MKAGFWVAPDGADEAVTLVPLGGSAEALETRRKANFLATSSAEELIKRCPLVASLLPRLAEALESQTAAAQCVLFDVTDFSADESELLSQVLGEGEVAGVAALTDGVVAQVHESVMAGLWRVRFTDAAGALVADYLEVGAIPQAVRKAAELAAPDLSFGAAPQGAMNVMPVLAEIRERMTPVKSGEAPHIVNFSLLPMNDADMAFLQEMLGDGPVRLVSRGYGTCRVLATGARNVWSVQFYNAMDEIILDTLEIGDVPAAACAADEDFRDSAERLREIDEAYFR
ncbi:hydrogenase expression/formation protein [Methylocystis parvus]|uniref:Hydrogenase expression/formation protein n=1 Tax=Methylocystis parvus TaxID=134 RepID=A0A6B8M387_9HYPH|nr:hydrogenase expression/formation protein [Methylocystis parvus]QGM96805.1 hydrogenase expression/formation protein [Methylocystis parvus]WBJ99317.1 hydrogenase expression/formation protein [Methylocystis parvus OBBP]